MATAHYPANNDNHWDTAIQTRGGALFKSLALLDSLGRSGLVLMPDVPSEQMLLSTAKNAGITIEQAALAYQAMMRSVE